MWFTYNPIPHVSRQLVPPLFLNKLLQVNSKGLFYHNFDGLNLKWSLPSMQSINMGENQPIYWAGLDSRRWV